MPSPVPVPYSPVSGPPYHIYTLSFDGAMSGMVNAVKAQTSLDYTTYNYFTQVARAWAIAWDQAWNSSRALDEIQAGICWQASQGFWGDGNRVLVQPKQKLYGTVYDPALDPATYTTVVDAMIATITAEENSFSADGIAVPLWGGSGGGGGFTPGGDLAGSSTVQQVVGINTMPLNTSVTSPTASGVWTGTGTQLAYRQLTTDDIAPGLTVTLSGGGAGTFEVGATWTPGATIVASPAANAAGVTAATLNDTLANSSNVLGSANPLNPPVASYTQSAQGASVGISLTMTKGGVTKTSNSIASTWTYRNYAGCDNAGTGTSIVQAANNATLVGGVDPVGALVGQLGAGGVGTSFTLTPSGTQFGYFACIHTASARTFTSGGFPFPMTRVGANYSFTNQFAQSTGFDLYVSNAITVPYTVIVAS